MSVSRVRLHNVRMLGLSVHSVAGVVLILSPFVVGQAPAAMRGSVSLDVYGNGDRIELLVAEDDGRGSILVHRRSIDGGESWSAPVTIEPSRGRMAPLSRNMDPQIVGVGDDLVAIWSAPSAASKWSAGSLATARSRDGGRTWTPGPRPNDDTPNENGEHAFIDAVAAADGLLHLVWLDARAGQQGLRFAASPDRGATWRSNVTIDAETCECCWNTIAMGWDDTPLVLYRDVPRDMAIARSDDRGRTWRRTGTVGAFGWEIQGCPDVGGGLTRGAAGEILATVWTGEDSRLGLYTLRSTDNGRTWEAPRRVGSDRAWHADIAYAGGELFVAWDLNGAAGAIEWSRSIDGGRSWTPAVRVSTGPARPSHPKLVAAGGRVRVFWTERVRAGAWTWRSAHLSASGRSSPR